jgi:hypothetical protein
MRKRCGGLTLGCVLLAGCASPAGDIAAKMDPSLPKFHTAECEAARQKAVEFDDGAAGREALALGAGLVPVVGVAGFVAVKQSEGKDAQERLTDLEKSCGQEALLPFMQEKAGKGRASAQAWLGQAYANGMHGLEKNPVQAAYWYDLAARQGNTDAENNLAAFYAEGFGVPKDDARAASLRQAAADEGVPEAQTNLASSYFDGRGVAQNFRQARLLFHAAAIHGHGTAELALADMYEHGQGGEKSDVLAYEWYNIAARYRIPGADAKRETTAQHLSDKEVALADRQVERCLSSRFQDCP